MSGLDPTFNTALQQPFVRGFTAVEVDLGSDVVNLVTGSGFVQFNGKTYLSYDPAYGSIDKVSPIGTAFSTSAPSYDLTFLPPNTPGIVGLNDPSYQGSLVKIWMGCISDATGLVQGQPYQVMIGLLDYSKSVIDQSNQSVTLRVVTAFDRMFVASEGSRQNQQYWTTIFPNITGYAFNVQALAPNFWGQQAPSNPQFPTVKIPATANDQLSGQSGGGVTSGTSYPGYSF